MSESMVERVAQAIYESHGFVRSWDHPKVVEMWHRPCRLSARAAIEEMREPTAGMSRVLGDAAKYGTRSNGEIGPKELMAEIIDAALQD